MQLLSLKTILFVVKYFHTFCNSLRAVISRFAKNIAYLFVYNVHFHNENTIQQIMFNIICYFSTINDKLDKVNCANSQGKTKELSLKGMTNLLGRGDKGDKGDNSFFSSHLFLPSKVMSRLWTNNGRVKIGQ